MLEKLCEQSVRASDGECMAQDATCQGFQELLSVVMPQTLAEAFSFFLLSQPAFTTLIFIYQIFSGFSMIAVLGGKKHSFCWKEDERSGKDENKNGYHHFKSEWDQSPRCSMERSGGLVLLFSQLSCGSQVCFYNTVKLQLSGSSLKCLCFQFGRRRGHATTIWNIFIRLLGWTAEKHTPKGGCFFVELSWKHSRGETFQTFGSFYLSLLLAGIKHLRVCCSKTLQLCRSSESRTKTRAWFWSCVSDKTSNLKLYTISPASHHQPVKWLLAL